MLTGRCLCGQVIYEIETSSVEATNCHCRQCQRSAGAAYISWFTVPVSGFRYLTGEPVDFASSSRGLRSFCGCCGTQLTFRSDDYPDEIDVTSCSLDHPEHVPPQSHTHVASRISWVSVDDGLPVFDGG